MITTTHSSRQFTKTFIKDGRNYRIKARLRFDDEYKNGHKAFSITGDIVCGSGPEYSGGCVHEEITEHFPELAKYIPWHLVSEDGPMHYFANTMYHAGDKDCHGLRKGEEQQLSNGKTGLPSWQLELEPVPARYIDSETQPESVTLKYVPWVRVGGGKERDLDAARRCAVWPDATDEDLTAPGLKERLEARLPALMAEFTAAMHEIFDN